MLALTRAGNHHNTLYYAYCTHVLKLKLNNLLISNKK